MGIRQVSLGDASEMVRAIPLRCTVEMQGGPCGRWVHHVSNSVDTKPVCLMHSRDDSKKSGDLYKQFQEEFVAMLAAAGDGIADFTKFVFPELRFPESEVKAECYFADAVFQKKVYLSQRHFQRDIWFVAAHFEKGWFSEETVFGGECSFYQTTFDEKTWLHKGTVFKGEAVFSSANFNGPATIEASFEGVAEFEGTTFEKETDLSGTVFSNQTRWKKAVIKGNCEFYGTIFKQIAVFEMTFEGTADFEGAEFEAEANFSNARFKKAVNLHTLFKRSLFLDTIFEQEVDFSHAIFVEEAAFTKTKFLGNADFTGVTFNGETTFAFPEFRKLAIFVGTRFQGRLSFSGPSFRADDTLEPGPVFSLARFSDESNARFYRTDLSHALFHNCDVDNVTFSSVVWRKRPETKKLMAFEEVIPLEDGQVSALRLEDGSRDYGLIAQLYQRLKKNYDDRLDYWAADDFHYGEMEMQRLAVPTLGPLLGLRQFYHRHLSLAAWYRRGSSYGNSYVRPAGWLLFVLVLFAALFPLTGLQRVAANPAAAVPAPLTYRSVWPARSPLHDKVWAEMKLLGRSELASVDTASFQKSSEYVPTYPWGRVLAIAEMLLTATLLALFLLAIRRQFRR
jgi:uncharacterized protein YjbI with pentapeptide repeats